MIKTLGMIAAAALLAGLATMLPGASERVQANALMASKGAHAANCEHRSWPYYERACIRDGSKESGRATAVRLVTTDRLSPVRTDMPAVDAPAPLWTSIRSLQTGVPAWARVLHTDTALDSLAPVRLTLAW